MPQSSKFPGIEVSHKDYSLSGDVHGSIKPNPVVTDALSQATTTYTTVPERIPPEERTPDREQTHIALIFFKTSPLQFTPSTMALLFGSKEHHLLVKYYGDGWRGNFYFNQTITIPTTTASSGDCTWERTLNTDTTELFTILGGITSTEITHRHSDAIKSTCADSNSRVVTDTVTNIAGSARGTSFGDLRVIRLDDSDTYEVIAPEVNVPVNGSIYTKQVRYDQDCDSGCTTESTSPFNSELPFGGLVKRVTANFANRLVLSDHPPSDSVSSGKVGGVDWTATRTRVTEIDLERDRPPFGF